MLAKKGIGVRATARSMISNALIGFFFVSFVAQSNLLSLAMDAEEIDRSADIRTGKISDHDLASALNQFHDAAKKTPTARLAELEKCYQRCHALHPDACEIDLIYACKLINCHGHAQAKAHLERRSKADLAIYWPARRIAIYLCATSESAVSVAQKLHQFASDLVMREKRPEVLALNARWLGQGLEGVLLSAPNNDKVSQIVEACEAKLNVGAAAYQAGRQAGVQLSLNITKKKQGAVVVIENEKQAVQQQIANADETIATKKVELEKAKATIEAARPEYEKSAAPYAQRMEQFGLEIQNTTEALRRAEQSYNDEKAKEEKGKSNDTSGARRQVQQSTQKLLELQIGYTAAEKEFNEICNEFNQKFAKEISIVGQTPGLLHKKAAQQKQNSRTRDRLDKRQHSEMAFQVVDFLRPDVDRILADLATKPKP